MLSLIALLGGGHGIFMTKPAFSISSRRRVWTNRTNTSGTNAVTHGSGAKEIMPSLNKQLRNPQQQRSEIAGNMAALFR